ncbi:hypothetical protein ANN_00666 [Periplaneta americana]|uniref:Uncharacterized protein n=1 Tax=Periplaneta americana TaxID=6978 RepID=A0ABQ8TTU5_PERAM|nr:hypothetical protein ANN_00666 [Periplaneta americana]
MAAAEIIQTNPEIFQRTCRSLLRRFATCHNVNGLKKTEERKERVKVMKSMNDDDDDDDDDDDRGLKDNDEEEEKMEMMKKERMKILRI